MPNEFDPDSAAEELARTEAMGSDAHRRAVARISTAALIDIAASLRILAAEVVFSGVLDDADTEPTVDAPIAEETRDFFVEGDTVRVIGDDTEPGEVVGLGFDQGEAYANVEFAGGQERYYVRNLERVVTERFTEADGSGNTHDVVAELTLNADGSGSVREVEPPAVADVEDLDDDFDGDHFTAADEALERLRANEAERKAEKKKGSKK
jgi:hypothetical protein